MWAFDDFAIVEIFDVIVDMSSSSFSIEKLIYSCDDEKRRISQIERTILEASKNFVVDKEWLH